MPSVTSSPGIAPRLSASDLSILQRWVQSQHPQQVQTSAPAPVSDHLQLGHSPAGIPASAVRLPALQPSPARPQQPQASRPAAISLASLRSGQAQLSAGAKGPAVEQVQQRLKLWGYDPGKVDGDYGPRTTSAVKRFQAERKIQVNGRVGAQTLAALEQTPVSVGRLQSSSEAQKLASVAQRVAARRGTVGWCYAGVADSVSRALGVELYGRSAYQASNILARHPDFKEVPTVKAKELPKLPAGAIVVWGKTKASPHGHISVALGNGREASDHIARQMTSLRGHTNFRVFMPVA